MDTGAHPPVEDLTTRPQLRELAERDFGLGLWITQENKITVIYRDFFERIFFYEFFMY